ncbi:hypothetical protein BU25DRAFT_451761 [Macroventuria anomochaeta]|uniref:Uncharacterized protein n=1 Tax=Macroventuria anomochaeta TaxID=301207 RepID=A0ACB6RPQ2_9PLEO|nr:uncharacterized protein BU25DRAFT_451761 [Macroventuria anomochaeta]KAF2622899.1 hypothetical protein BU25DRAFT_451761 [Macroventuria anomochaeta]
MQPKKARAKREAVRDKNGLKTRSATAPPMIVAVRTAGTMFVAVVAVALTACPSIHHVAAIRGLALGSAAICGDYGPANAMVDANWDGMGGGFSVTNSGIVRWSEAIVQS